MATQEQKNASDLGAQAIALAEQLGRIVGTVEGTAESWLNRQKLTDQLTRVRDGATQMLEGLTAGAERGRKTVTEAAVRSVRPATAKATASVAKARTYLTGGGRQPKRRKGKTAKAAAVTRARQADPSRAPGKRRRKPAPAMRGMKKSDERIPKLRTAAAVRQRRKSNA